MRLMVVEVLAFLAVFFGFGQIAAAASSGVVHITVRIRPPDSALIANNSKTRSAKPVIMIVSVTLVYSIIASILWPAVKTIRLPLSLESRPWTVRHA